MCGIAGMMSLTSQPLSRPELVGRMLERLIHRGPDEEGFYMNPSRTVSLGHRRLRIIDLATGRQPLGNEDGSVMITFNGEIYGFKPLREDLQSRGHRFTTRTDTEVIVHLYDEYGISCLHKLKGMFAFALWDERNETLFVARDRIGKKPLYYALTDGKFIFASELQALLAALGDRGEIDELALDQYLTLGYIPAPRTIYQRIKKLEAGHYLVIKSGNLQDEKYWAPQSSSGKVGSLVEAKQELVERLRIATAVRMVSDVPIGCFLSGGVDSSTVLSFMAELSSRPVKTFSIGFPDEDYSELPYARTIARHFGTDHHEYILEPDAVGVLDEMVSHFGEPFADSSALPTWYLAQLTRKSVTVALTGDGGDELFGGYGWHETGRLLDNASGWIPRWIAQLISVAALPLGRSLKRIGKAAELLSLSPGLRYATLRQQATRNEKTTVYSRDFLHRSGTFALDWLAHQYDQVNADEPLNRMMATDLMTYMAEDLLVKVDRTSMAHSLECRSPLLDTDLAEWVLALPSAWKVNSRGGKRLLLEAVRDRFPNGFLDRPKQGFSVPLERWFRNGLRKVVIERVVNGPLAGMQVFDPAGLKRIVEEHFSGRANHQALVWALLVLASWKERSGH
jgi:asparagine synthase (glutamine-hydrolysing)